MADAEWQEPDKLLDDRDWAATGPGLDDFSLERH
jgi:hypothetical protein